MSDDFWKGVNRHLSEVDKARALVDRAAKNTGYRPDNSEMAHAMVDAIVALAAEIDRLRSLVMAMEEECNRWCG